MSSSLDAKYSKWDNFEDSDEEAAPTTGSGSGSGSGAGAGTGPKAGVEGASVGNSITRFDIGDEGDFAPSDDMFYTPEEVTALKKLPLVEKEVWQVMEKPLHAFVRLVDQPGDPSDFVTRPRIVLFVDLYPRGEVLRHRECEPSHEPASEEWICKELADLFKDPPRGQAQHRPQSVVFSNVKHAIACFNSLKAVGVQCSQLVEAPKTIDLVKSISKLYIDEGLGSNNPTASKPLIKAPGVNKDFLRVYYDAMIEFFRRAMWERVKERQALRVRVDKSVIVGGKVVPGGVVWATVMGQDALMAWRAEREMKKAKKEAGGAGGAEEAKGGDGDGDGGDDDDDDDDDEPPTGMGLALFWTRWDAEQRCLSGATSEAVKPALNPIDMVCAFQDCGKTARDCGRNLLRCARCKVNYYCNATCQRSDWKAHKPNCVPANKLKPGSIYWCSRETSALAQEVQQQAFEDLDVMDEFGMVESAARRLVPYTMLLINGDRRPPTVEELVWLTRVARVMTAMDTAESPNPLENIVPQPTETRVQLRDPSTPDATSPSGCPLFLEWETTEAFVRTDAILRAPEYDQISEMLVAKTGVSLRDRLLGVATVSDADALSVFDPPADAE